jgi:hypothetical protein
MQLSCVVALLALAMTPAGVLAQTSPAPTDTPAAQPRDALSPVGRPIAPHRQPRPGDAPASAETERGAAARDTGGNSQLDEQSRRIDRRIQRGICTGC